MVAIDCSEPTWKSELVAVSERIFRTDHPCTGTLLAGEQAVERDATEANHHAQILEQHHLLVQPRGAIAQFPGSRLITRGSAPPDRCNPETLQFHSILKRRCF